MDDIDVVMVDVESTTEVEQVIKGIDREWMELWQSNNYFEENLKNENKSELNTLISSIFDHTNNINESNKSAIAIECTVGYDDNTFLSSPIFQGLVYVLYFAIFCVALLGNGAVCYIVRTPRMRTVTNYFIGNLALGDILMSVFCVPFTFVPQLILTYWPFGITLCRIVNYSQAVSVLVSAYTLVALAGDRYRAITRPLRPRLSKPAAQGVIAAVWFGALATAAPIPIVSTLVAPSEYYQTCHMFICREEWPNSNQAYYYSMALMGLQFVIPLVVLIFTYTRIAIAVWGVRPPGEAENLRDMRMAQSKRKMVKMIVVVVVVFTICWLPMNTLVVIMDETMETWRPLPYVWFAFHWLAMSHSCYNPIIYCYMNARFRTGFMIMMSKIPCCKKYIKDHTTYGDTINRSSVAGNIPMKGLESGEHLLFRMNTSSTYVSIRRNTTQIGSRPSSIQSQAPNSKTAPKTTRSSLANGQNRV